jgi:hypothetical protein
MGNNILHFIFITILLNPHTYVVLGYILVLLILGYFIFMVVGILSWIIRLLAFIYKFFIGILHFLGVLKRKNYKYSTDNNHFGNELGEGRIVDLGDHVGVLTKISKKRIARDYLREQKIKQNKNQYDDSREQKEKSYNEKMNETMDQEAQAKGWH